jgi:hypothetical protein
MSRTDNTQPIEVIEADPSFLRIPRNSGSHSMIIAGGVNSEGSKTRLTRRQFHHKVRGQVRNALKQAGLALDFDTIDIPPHRVTRRQLGWRAGLA